MFEPTVLFQGYFYGQNLETFEQMRSFVEFQIPVTFQWKGQDLRNWQETMEYHFVQLQ